jgi:hypothetical protein
MCYSQQLASVFSLLTPMCGAFPQRIATKVTMSHLFTMLQPISDASCLQLLCGCILRFHRHVRDSNPYCMLSILPQSLTSLWHWTREGEGPVFLPRCDCRTSLRFAWHELLMFTQSTVSDLYSKNFGAS